MDAVDKKILNILQTRFPLVPEPFDAVGEELGLTGDEVIDLVRKLKADGVIRRIGADFESRKLGYASTADGSFIWKEEGFDLPVVPPMDPASP